MIGKLVKTTKVRMAERDLLAGLKGGHPKGGSSEGDCHSIHRRVFPVLALQPELRPAALVGPVAMFRHRFWKWRRIVSEH
jgi:hypothetical protein